MKQAEPGSPFSLAARRRWTASFIKIPLIYLAIGSVYIVASTLFFAARADYGPEVELIELLKGLGFVAGTSIILSLLLYRTFRRARVIEQSFQDAVESLPDATFIVAVPDRRVVFVNSACSRMFGYSKDEMIGRPTEFLHVDAAHCDEFQRRSALVLNSGENYVGEYEMRRRNGEVFPTSHVVAYLSSLREPTHVISLVRDESASHEQRRQVELNAERLRLIAENLGEVFWIYNAEAGKVEFVSPAYERIWGRPPTEIYRDPYYFLNYVHPEDRERVASSVRDDRAGYDLTYRILRPDGETLWLHDRAVPISDTDGSLSRLVGITEDVTTFMQQQSELRLAQKLQAVGQLTGGIAHDFKNLLMVIKGNAENLRATEPATGIAAESLDDIVVAADRAADLAARLLSFSHRSQATDQDVPVDQFVERVCSALGPVLGKHVSVSTKLAAAGRFVHADPTEFETTLMNLLLNARDAMPNGGTIGVETSFVQQGTGAAHVLLTISDTGDGMSETTRRKALDPFFTTKRPGRGVGLGLSIVDSFVKSTGGTIDIESSVGHGTTVSLKFPQIQEPADAGELDRSSVTGSSA